MFTVEMFFYDTTHWNRKNIPIGDEISFKYFSNNFLKTVFAVCLYCFFLYFIPTLKYCLVHFRLSHEKPSVNG